MQKRKTWKKEELIAFEKRIGDLYLDNKLPFLFHLSGGNEEALIEIFQNIRESDYVLSNHRSHYHALLHGIPPDELEEHILNGRSMFVYDRSRNFFVSAIIGATPAIAIGIALALKRKNSNQKVWCFVGDGTTDNGHFFEAVRYADGWDLPVHFIVENNNRSVEASNEERWGRTGNWNWESSRVTQYHYDITYPHARMPGTINIAESNKLKKTDEEYFPPLVQIPFPDYPDLNEQEISYKNAMEIAMSNLGQLNTLFIGYNVARGDAMGTLKGVPSEKKFETPVAENLMAGICTGLAIEGTYLPILYIERQDFILNAIDQIVNHMDKIERISRGQYKVPVIIRAVVADSGPFYSGPTHSQDFTEMLRAAVDFPVIEPRTGIEVLKAFRGAVDSGRPCIIIERKSYY